MSSVHKNKIAIVDIENNIYYKNNKQYFDLLVSIIQTTYLNAITNKIRKNTNLLYWINLQIPKLKNSFYTLNTKIFWILNNIVDFPVCSNCNKPLINKNANIFTGYKRRSENIYCSIKCSNSDIKTKNKRVKTCLDRYGVKSYTQTQECKDKVISTCLDRYGVINGGASKQALDKIKNTNLERYGVECSFQRDEIKQKSKETCIKKYGAEHNMKSEKGLKEYQTAMQNKYGVISNLQLETIKEKSRQTKLKKYGNENYANVKKCKQTKLERYGDENYNNHEKIKNTMKQRYGVEAAQQCRNIRIKSGYRYTYDNHKFDSSPELALYIWLKDNNIEFEYQPSKTFIYMFNNTQHVYIPDFKIGNQFYEIKGDQFVDKNTGKWICPYNRKNDKLYEEKYQCCILNNIIILYSCDYKKYLDYIDQKYGKQYLKQFKNKH